MYQANASTENGQAHATQKFIICSYVGANGIGLKWQLYFVFDVQSEKHRQMPLSFVFSGSVFFGEAFVPHICNCVLSESGDLQFIPPHTVAYYVYT